MTLTQTHKILLGALLVQVLLTGAMWMPRDSGDVALHGLIDFESDAVTEITIDSGKASSDAGPLHLVRKSGAWSIESAGGYPANDEKVEDMLDKLTGIEVRSPIASQSSSHKQLKVSDNAFDRKITFTTTDGSLEMVLGAAASSSSHVRLAGEDDVYVARDLSVYSVSDRANSYYDPIYVKFETVALSSLTIHNALGTFVLLKEQDAWTLGELPEGMAVDQAEVAKVLPKLASVRMSEPVGEEVMPAYGLDGSTRVEWTIETFDQTEASGYTVGADDGAKVYVKSDDNDFVVQAFSSSFSTLRELTAEQFLIEAVEEEEAPE